MFEGHKCIDPENLADQTIDRVSLRVEDLRDTYIGNQALYFHGVARKLLYEYHRSRREINIEVEHAEEAPEIFGAEYECLRECLAELSPQHRDLILDYHLDDKSAKIERRRVMASELGVEPGALRIRAHRIRAFLEDCVKKCLSKTD
jgi:DNA-directed RNA polymerase specialized sigma24 family protein